MAAVFNELMDRLNDSFGRLSRFSADIAHELRTPVNNLLGEIHVAMSRARSPAEYQDLLGSLSEEADQLKTLIDSLLFLARAEHPETEINREALDVGHEVELVREFYIPAAGEAGVDINFAVPSGIDFLLDRNCFNTPWEISFKMLWPIPLQADMLRLLWSEPRIAFLSVLRDNGIGIAKQHLPHVLDRFYRVDSARAKATGGVGLGLAIVHSIVRLHGGELQISSEVSKEQWSPWRSQNTTLPAQLAIHYMNSLVVDTRPKAWLAG